MISAVLALLLSPALAQTVPAGRLQTLRTPHFRVHYPVDATPFALEVASRIEGFRERVSEEVGVTLDKRVDVVIVDPYGLANGQAIGDSRFPRMRLYASPPPADAIIGHNRDWAEGLVVHEDTHIVHLTIPSRNRLRRSIQRLLGVGPVAEKTRRWIIEGYATVIEGRLSGAGRPNDDATAVWLRLLARTGRFPTYNELDASNRYRGSGFAYVVGAAFLQWLESTSGREAALRDLWARLSAKRSRGLSEAFEGVFGDTPREAYGRFVAEIMAEAFPTPLADESDRVFERRGTLGAPSLSEDGTRIAVPVAVRNHPPQLLVLDTAIDEVAQEQSAEFLDQMLAEDPEDVAPVPPSFVSRSVDARRVHRNRIAIHPRFVGNDLVLFDAWTPDRRGRLHADLFMWEVDTGFERRLTRRKGLSQPDPDPTGEWAVAVRERWGDTQIVVVDLRTGAIEPVTEPSLKVQVDCPRVTPDGAGLVWLENRGNGYGWVFFDLETDTARWHPVTLDGPQLRNLAFGPQGNLFAEVAWQGEVGIADLGSPFAAPGPVRVDTLRTLAGGAMTPEVGADGALWVTTFTPDGKALHRLAPETREAHEPGLHGPILDRPSDDVDLPPVARSVPIRRRYGFGSWSWIPLGGFGVSTVGQGQGELALTGGDVMGRFAAQGWLAATRGGNGVTGAAVAVSAQGAAQHWQLTGYLGRDRRYDLRRAGGTLLRRGRHTWGTAATVRTALGGFVERVELGPDATAGRTRFGGSVGIGASVVEPRHEGVRISASAVGQMGRTGDEPWEWVRGSTGLDLGRRGALRVRYDIGRTTGTTLLDQWTHGGSAVSVWPTLATGPWLADPAFGARTQQGTHYDRLDLGLGSWQLQVFATRTRVGESWSTGGFTLVGIRGGTQVSADPFIPLVADGQGSVGVGRTVEDPGSGWSWRDGSWVAWASWTWR